MNRIFIVLCACIHGNEHRRVLEHYTLVCIYQKEADFAQNFAGA
jgi:hypothetical protein